MRYYKNKLSMKQCGLCQFVRKVSTRVFKTYSYKMHYLVLDTNIDVIQQRLQEFDLSVKELEYEDFLMGDSTVFTPRKLESVFNRLNDGTHKAYGIIENDRLIYSTWISTKELSLPVAVSYTLASNEGLLEDSYCSVDARGRGLHYKMNLYRIARLYELGKNRVVAIVMDGNAPAFKVQFKSGFREIGTFYCGKIFGISFSTLNNAKYEGK